MKDSAKQRKKDPRDETDKAVPRPSEADGDTAVPRRSEADGDTAVPRPSEDGVWVLDTETKGTGANMVPLERVLRRGSNAVPGFTLPKRRQAPAEPLAPRGPYQFRILELMTRRVLGDRVSAQQAVEVLRDVRSIVDVTAYVWEPESERWRRLTLDELRLLWAQR